MEGVDKFVPQVRVSNGNTPKWFTQEIRQLINKLRSRRRKNRRNPSNERQTRIDDDTRVLKQKIDIARSNWERNLVDEFAGNSNHMIFNHMRSLTKNTLIPQLMVFGTKEATEDLSSSTNFSTQYNRDHQQFCLTWLSVS
jgi:hypothetical protein